MSSRSTEIPVGLKVSPAIFFREMMAGLVMSIISVPGSIANGVLAGVNPIFGVYSTIIGTTVAAVFTSSVIMNVDTTGATALAAGGVLGGISPAQHLDNLVVLVLLVGLFQLIFGLLNLGKLTDFISNAVMTGFISGVAVQAILGQVGDLTGFYSQAGGKIARVWDTLLHAGQIDLPTLSISIVTILLIFGLERTRYARFAYIVGLLVTTLLVWGLGLASVGLVGDATEIPQSFPVPHLPDLSLVPAMLLPAFAIAIIGLVQSAGVSQSIPNPNGEYPNSSGDFRGQGIANIATGFFGGLPVGGSLSGTALIRSIGGRTRWANIFTGIFSLVMVLLFARLIEALPLPAIAGVIVMAALSIINLNRIETAWRTGPAPTAIMAITFIGTLLMPIHYAVFLGVLLHILLFAFQEAESVRIEQIVPLEAGQYSEAAPPEQLHSNQVIILQPIGSLFFAGSARFENQLPAVAEATGSVVILRLRDRDEVGSTFIRVIERYARSLQAQGNLLLLAGINERVLEQMHHTALMEIVGQENVFPVRVRFGGSTELAIARAAAWQAQQQVSGQ